MMKNTLTLCLLLLTAISISAQNKYTLSGYVKDKKNGEEIIGATIAVKSLGKGTVTNSYGFYSLTLPEGSYTVTYSFVGYKATEQSVILNKNITLNVELNTEDIELQEVEVTAEKTKTAQEKPISMLTLEVAKAKELPALFGEVDLLKSIQLLPGIQAAGEGNAGFNVRGGANDQNLILLDEATVYNASHLFGFFSVFNADAIKDVDIYKGGIPAKYGGRLSSLLDIRMRDGNNKKFSGSGGIGLISSRLTLEGPIQKEKSSFIISGRRTYADLFLKLSPNKDLRNNTLYFYDFNAKANYKLSDKDRIYLSGYFGRDVLGLANLFGFDWGNATATLRWNHIYGSKLFSNITLIYSNFDYGINIDVSETQNFSVKSGIDDIGLKADYAYYANPNSTIYFGGQTVWHKFSPGKFEPIRSTSIFQTDILPSKNALESSVYIDHKYTFKKRLDIRYGLRFTAFDVLGKSTEYLWDKTNPDLPVTDTLEFASLKKIKSYYGPEPRIALSYSLNENMALKTSWDHTYQFIHQLSNSATTFPTDLWVPSGLHIKPQISDQYALGFFHTLKKGWEYSVELYYKDMKNQIDYRDNANLVFNRLIERELLFGKGWSYGSEFLIMKNNGKLTGWIAYTLSKTMRQVEGINNNEPYAVKNDRRHNISFVSTYKFTERISLSLTWVYATGNAVTFPGGRYEFDGEILAFYPRRSNYRMPAYHRGDLSLTINGKKKEKRRFESSWNFSVYNFYNRANAFSITFRQQKDENGNPTGRTEAVQTTLFKLIPSITWNFKF
jgi:hypothetical protein